MSGNHLNSVWTPEVIDYFLTLTKAPENFAYREIAKRMNARFGLELTKNGCIGKGRRMGLPPRDPHPYKPVKPKVRIPPKDTGISIQDLERWNCTYVLDPFDSRPPYKYCGMPVKDEGGSWCAKHYDRVFVKSRW